jgi:hypothetical protein
MKKSDHVLAALAMIIVVVQVIRLVFWLYDDLQHPERWDSDIYHDPRAYLSFMAVCLGGGTCLLVYARRKNRESKRRLDSLISQANRELHTGKPDRANALLDEFAHDFTQKFGKRPEEFR